MSIVKAIWKPMVQRAVTGRARRFRMRRVQPEWPGALRSPGLYLHVPFCKNLCPYCPYNRVEYDEGLFAAYERAVKQEIDLYAPYIGGQPFTSLYIGGGTPTVNWPGLVSILKHLRERLGPMDDICIELHPGNMDAECLSALREAGVTRLSIGVESTSDAILERIGRSHDGRVGPAAVSRAVAMGFASVNADLMFALPGQTLAEWQADVEAVVGLGVDQLSTYPMFSFPYSDLGAAQGIRQVARPAHRTVKAMLDFTDEHCDEKGLPRCAVWSWLRPGRGKFSSITRHHYIGFGPSAASMTGTDFYVNTFDVRAYADTLPAERPVAASMPVNRRIEMAYWLYWRVYELEISQARFRDVFGPDASLDAEFGLLLRPLMLAGLLERTQGGYRVTKPGAYWIHRLQNEYSLSYINHLWGACRREPWPEEVRL
ncbi:MAG: radical SAM protein [Candidatus Hydrogenedentes bacterium]|nr:radical SAM protein [Candidatus Hydrogenedentota bacterium]